jgi:eukaryotic-like serine/threonine-protein kinase
LNRLGGRFILERQIGVGGMARVFLGRDQVLERPVAIKILNPGHGGTDISTRFRREGRTAARLSHPNIVQVFDAGEDEFEGREASYIVMEYISGGDLKALIDEKGPLPNDELAKLGAEVSAGLAHAHASGVIHRDIKPHNILIDAYGRPKLTDFGIARALDSTHATQTGSYLGTALYSAPEQLRGEKVTSKSDVYSLGIALYQAAVGQTPFTGTPIEIASQHVSREPAVPSVLGANLSDEVEKLILDCVQKNPELRPSAKEVHERLQEEASPARDTYLAPPISEPPPDERTSVIPPEEPPQEPLQELPPQEPPPQEPPPQDPPPREPPPGPGRREGRRGRGPILLAVAILLLVLLGVALAYAMLGGNEGVETALTPQEESQKASSEDTEGQGAQSAGDQEATQEQAAAEDTAAGGSGDSSEEDAAQTVEDHYAAAEDGDYETAYNLLSERFRQTQAPSQAAFSSQFSTLESIEFEEGPTAQVSGNTATVTGVTIATHTDRTERNTVTWTLIDEDGEWKIDGINFRDQQLI